MRRHIDSHLYVNLRAAEGLPVSRTDLHPTALLETMMMVEG